tara:strand:+ start:3422 stop:3622 length:201 start_codon:yes stop_codon:yes gene_type:complete
MIGRCLNGLGYERHNRDGVVQYDCTWYLKSTTPNEDFSSFNLVENYFSERGLIELHIPEDQIRYHV